MRRLCSFGRGASLRQGSVAPLPRLNWERAHPTWGGLLRGTAPERETAMNLYQPTHAEISEVMSRAATRWPQLESRCTRAGEILANGIDIDPVAYRAWLSVIWEIDSQTHPDKAYTVIAQCCNCPDTRAPMIACQGRTTRRMCKHVIAVASYVRICSQHACDAIARGELETVTHPNGAINLFARNLGTCTVRKSDTGPCPFQFWSDLSALHFAKWLALPQVERQPILVEDWPITTQPETIRLPYQDRVAIAGWSAY